MAQLVSWLLLLLVRFLTGTQGRWYGCPPSVKQRIYYANHQSHADIVLIWGALPKPLRKVTRAIAAKDYWTSSAFKQWLTTNVFNAVYVDRARVGDQDPLEPLIEALQQGDSIILFPEGTRGYEDEPQTFKAGLYNLAKQFPQVEVIPVWINNVQRVMPKGEILPVPILCSVTFGFPCPLHENESRGDYLIRARQALIQLKNV